jgi:dTDP-glucose 4,6-dehydratase
VLARGQPGSTYNIGGNAEMTNIDVVNAICAFVAESKPGRNYAGLITYVQDRPGHDRRYAIDATRVRTELQWEPGETFATGMRKTVQWYVDNPQWLADVMSGEYRKWVAQQYAT